MPAQTQLRGTSFEPLVYEVSTRRILAYASVLGAFDQMDDMASTFSAVPQFCVIPEWQLTIAYRAEGLGLTDAESRMAVHVGQDTEFHRRVIPGETLQTDAEIVAVRPSRSGALVVTQFITQSLTSQEPIATTQSTVIYRGVEVAGDPQTSSTPSQEESRQETQITRGTTVAVALDRGFAHRYSECADIWNPIHTERAVALAAGLPDIIVHGTALWALAGQEIISRFCGGDPSRLQSLCGRFAAMVIAGDAIEIELGCQNDTVSFVVKNAQGERAVSNGHAKING